MLEDYKKAVISNYHYKKEKGLLSSNLLAPTPAKLRTESLVALATRTKKEDEKIIRNFFNGGLESNDYAHIINKFDRDKLKPLDNFIAGETEVRDYNNVELLAWLIDFEPRPYKSRIGYVYDDNIDTSKKNNEKSDSPSDDQTGKGQTNGSTTTTQTGNSKSRKTFVLITIPLLLASGVYLYSDNLTKVYICSGSTSKRYHINSKCPALKNCSNSPVSTTVAEAKKNGKTLCGWE